MSDSSPTNSNVGEGCAESSNVDEIRVRNISEITESITTSIIDNVAVDSAQTKRKLPSWMVTASSQNDENSPSKRIKSKENENEGVLTNTVVSTSNSETLEMETNGVSCSKTTNHASECNVDNTTSTSSIKNEPGENNTHNLNTNHDKEILKPCDDTQEVKVKREPNNNQIRDVAASTSTSHQNNDIKPSVKVEKADASSSSRESCKYGIRCYRRNPMHRIEEAHPGDHDYKRPQYPPPPDGTPDCPYGKKCFRRNPIHFQQYNHPVDTDFEQNYQKYRLRQRRKRQQQQQNINDSDDSELDEYDLDDPFINDDSDLDYVPSDDDLEDTEDLDYDDCDQAEE